MHDAPTTSASPAPHHEIRPPLTSVTPTNQTGIIAILSGFSLGLVLISVGVRFYARRNAGVHRCDDAAFYAAVVFAFAEFSVTLYLVSVGLGKDLDLLDPESDTIIQSGVLATSLLYILTLCLSKVSWGLMLVWLTPFDAQKRAVYGLIGGSIAWMVSSLFVEGFGCHDPLGQCAGYWSRWLYISIFDMLIEVSLISASVYMVWGRQISSRAKWTVVGAFSCRIPNIAITLTRLIFFRLVTPTTAIRTARIHGTVQLATGYTIVACVIPYLRPLMQSYENDGTRGVSGDATFKLSERSRSSKGSGSGPGSGEIVEEKGKGKLIGMELNDVSRLLGPERPAFRRMILAEEGLLLPPVPSLALMRDTISSV